MAQVALGQLTGGYVGQLSANRLSDKDCEQKQRLEKCVKHLEHLETSIHGGKYFLPRCPDGFPCILTREDPNDYDFPSPQNVLQDPLHSYG